MCSMLNVPIGLWGNLIYWNPWTAILNNLCVDIQDLLMWLSSSLKTLRKIACDKHTLLSFFARFHWNMHCIQYMWMKNWSFTLPIPCYFSVLVLMILETRWLTLEGKNVYTCTCVCCVCEGMWMLICPPRLYNRVRIIDWSHILLQDSLGYI